MFFTHIQGSVPFVTSYLCIIHLFLIISPLIFQFPFLCRPLSLPSFLLPDLKRFTSPLSPCLATLPPVRLNSYLPLYVSSSLLFPPFFSIFLPSYFLLCALYPRLCPSPCPSSCPRLKLNHRRHEPGPTTSLTGAPPHRPKKQTLKNKIKYIKPAVASPLHGQFIFSDL